KCPVGLLSYILPLPRRLTSAVDSPNISVVEKPCKVQRSSNRAIFEGGKKHEAAIRLSNVFRSGDGKAAPGNSSADGPGRGRRSFGLRHRAIFLRRLLAHRLAVQP